MTDKKEKEPMFYIQQPKIQFPKVEMQTTYTSKKSEPKEIQNSKPAEEERKTDNNGKGKSPERNIKVIKEENLGKINETDLKNEDEVLNNTEKLQETIGEFEAKKRKEAPSYSFTTEKKSSFKRLKSFKEMNMMERIDYLIDFPKQLPPVPCVFETEEKVIRGFLIGKTEDFIEIKLFNEKQENISIQSLKGVKMMGMRR